MLSKRALRELGGGVSQFAEVLKAARVAGVIDLGQGFPDHQGSTVARSAVADQSGRRWRPTYCEIAIAGKPRMAASRAAAAVPEM